MDWTPEMRSAAMRDAALLVDLALAARLAVERVDEWSTDHLTDDTVREWWGHVEPALAGLRRALNRTEPKRELPNSLPNSADPLDTAE